MKRIIVGLLLIISSLAAWSQTDSYGKISMTASYYTGWDNINWGEGSRTNNFQAFDTEFRYAVSQKWGVWGRINGGDIGDDVSGLVWEGYEDSRYLKTLYGAWDDGYHVRHIISAGVSYSYERGPFRIVPKLGFGISGSDNRSIGAKIKVENSNEEYEVWFENRNSISVADLGLEFNYKVWKVVYATAGFRYVQGLGKYKQERNILNVYGEGLPSGNESNKTSYKSKLPNHFGMNIGIGVSF